MLKVHICALLFILCSHESWSLTPDIQKFAKNVFEMIAAVKKADKYHGTENLITAVRNDDDDSDDEIISTLKTIKYYSEIEFDLALDLLERLKRVLEVTHLKAKIKEHIVDIDRQFRRLVDILQRRESMNGTSLAYTIETFLEVRYNIRDLRHILQGQPGTVELKIGLFEELRARAISEKDSCGQTAFRIGKLITDIVHTVIIIEIEALAVMTFILPMLSQHDLVERISNEHDHFHYALRYYLQIAKQTMNQARGVITGCDPPEWVRDVSYFEMERMIQEVVFRYDGGYGNNCGKQASRSNEGRASQFISPETACHGKMSDCLNIPQKVIDGCLSEPGAKRFEWMRTEQGSYNYGTALMGSCLSGRPVTRLPNVQLDAMYCLCACYEEKNWVSMKMMISDIKSNMVIIGLRFKRVNETLYLQPKQGLLLKNGDIDPIQQNWIDIPVEGDEELLDSKRAVFFLDDFMVPSKSVVTGVGLKHACMESSNGKILGFKLVVIGEQFDYSTGELLLTEDSPHLDTSGLNNCIPSGRTRINIDPRNSIYDPRVIHAADREKNTYVKLGRSSLLHDMGQSVVPLFHGIELVTDPPAPLGGIGIFHKGGVGKHLDLEADKYRRKYPRFAGFIALRLHSLDYANYLKEFEISYEKAGV